MGFLKKIGNYFMKNLEAAKVCGLFVGLGAVAPDFIDNLQEFLQTTDISQYEKSAQSACKCCLDLFFAELSAYFAAYSAALARCYFYKDDSDKLWPKNQKGDKKVRDEIMEKLSLEELAKTLPNNTETVSAAPSLIEIIRAPMFDDANAGDKLAKLAKKYDSKALHSNAIIAKFNEGKLDEAFLDLRDFLNKLDGKKLKMDFLSKTFNEVGIGFNQINLEHQLRRMGLYFSTALSELFMGNPEKSLWYSTLAGEFVREVDHPAKVEVSVLDAFFTDALKSSLSKEKWNKTIELTKVLPEWERLGETKSVVKVIPTSNFLKKSLVFKESKNLDDLVSEAETSKFFKENLNINTPNPLYISEEPDNKGIYTYVMTYLDGKTLLSFIEKNNKKYLPKVIDNLVEIHSKFPVEKIRKGKLNLSDALEKRLSNPYLNLDKEISSNLRKGYQPLISLFNKYEQLWRYNKDAHPENWLISEDEEVMIIDTENNYSSPVVFDLANLFGYGKYFSFEEMDEGVEYYFDKFKSFEPNNQVTIKEFELLFWNAVIHRSFFLCSAWSDPSRSSLHEKRTDLVDNSLNILKFLKYQDFYKENEESYSILGKGLSALKNKL